MHAPSRPSITPLSLLIDEKTVVALVLLSGKTLKRRIKEGRFASRSTVGVVRVLRVLR
jgi:hypothetical protein